MMMDNDEKALPLNAPDIPLAGQKDCPDGMIPSMVLLAIMTSVIVYLLYKKQFLSE